MNAKTGRCVNSPGPDPNPLEVPMPTTVRDPFDRFIEKVNRDGPVPNHNPSLGPCWLWLGKPRSTGYGTMQVAGRMEYVHRLSHVFFIGLIPDGLQVDHLCRVLLCVNPSHLEAVTQRENLLRGESPSGQYARRTHCLNGHELTPDNLVHEAKFPNQRKCRTCKNARAKASRDRARRQP